MLHTQLQFPFWRWSFIWLDFCDRSTDETPSICLIFRPWYLELFQWRHIKNHKPRYIKLCILTSKLDGSLITFLQVLSSLNSAIDKFILLFRIFCIFIYKWVRIISFGLIESSSLILAPSLVFDILGFLLTTSFLNNCCLLLLQSLKFLYNIMEVLQLFIFLFLYLLLLSLPEIFKASSELGASAATTFFIRNS